MLVFEMRLLEIGFYFSSYHNVTWVYRDRAGRYFVEFDNRGQWRLSRSYGGRPISAGEGFASFLEVYQNQTKEP